MTTRIHTKGRKAPFVEWPTLGVLVACYFCFVMGTTWVAAWSLFAGIGLTALAIALFSSLQHEVIHGHPFRHRWLNEALVFPGLTVAIPFIRFRDTHLDHHMNPELTDPLEDPESNYLTPQYWDGLPGWVQKVLNFNNSLLGRFAIGTAVSQYFFMLDDMRQIRNGNRRVLNGWLWHIPAVGIVLFWLLGFADMPIWAYLCAAYLGLSLVKIRTFLEHRAHERAGARTVIIEDRGFLSFLFLNNNLHAVHHAFPQVPWYRLWPLYRDNRDRFLKRNGGYVYASYLQIMTLFAVRRKDPVPHPFWNKRP